MIGSYVPFNCFSYFRVGPTRGSSQIWGSKFSDADYKRTVRDINDLFFADDRFMFPSIAFHNFVWVRHVVPPEFGGQNFQTQITREPYEILTICFLGMIDLRSLQSLFIILGRSDTWILPNLGVKIFRRRLQEMLTICFLQMIG